MDSLPKHNTCSICNGSGLLYPRIDGKIDYGQVVVCKCESDKDRQQRNVALLKYCELPPMNESMNFTNFKVSYENKKAFETAKRVALNPDKMCWVTFMGKNDRGKTHLAISICKAWIAKGIPAKYVFVPLLLDELREGFNKDSSERYELRFKRFCTVPLLLLDDVGAESSTNWVNEKLETIVDYRLMNKLSLIVTTNKSIDELSARLGSRLIRHPNAELITILGESFTIIKSGNKNGYTNKA